VEFLHDREYQYILNERENKILIPNVRRKNNDLIPQPKIKPMVDNIDKITKECQFLNRAVCNSNRAKAVAETINKILIETLIQVSINTPRIEKKTIIKNVPKSVLTFFKTKLLSLFKGMVKNKSINQINAKNRPEIKEYQLDSNKNQPKLRQVTRSNAKETQVIVVISCSDFIEISG
jgi:hypothetical protein